MWETPGGPDSRSEVTVTPGPVLGIRAAAGLGAQAATPRQMTQIRVPLKRTDGRAQWQNPCDTKRLLSLLVIRAMHRHRKV